MSKAPDLSAFPIPRKGSARPIEAGNASEPQAPEAARIKERSQPSARQPVITKMPAEAGPEAPPQQKRANAQAAPPYLSGQLIALTVKLDEDRYLRLTDAGRPGPGRLKRRSSQEMMIEAVDEWFAKRGL